MALGVPILKHFRVLIALHMKGAVVFGTTKISAFSDY